MQHRGRQFTNEADARAFADKHKRAWISRLFDYEALSFVATAVKDGGKNRLLYVLKPNARRVYIGWHVAYFG